MGQNNKVVQIIFTIVFLMFFIPFFLFNAYSIFASRQPEMLQNMNLININWQLIASIILIAIIVLYPIITYNKLVNLKQKVKQSISGIDVYLKQRFDLIPNIVETVKGYASYEKEVLDNITQIRASYSEIKDDNIEGLAEINNKYTKILAVVEAYPELKANKEFLELQKTLSKVENQLQAARRIYNCEVTDYNTKVMSFPSNVVAGIFGFKQDKLFEIDLSERKNIEVKV